MWMFAIVLVIAVLVLFRDSPIAHALASRIERRSIGEASDLLADRIASLEGEVERLSAEVRRLDDEGQFLHRLLLEKGEEHEALPGSERNRTD
jgi:hypothetical protein